MKKVLFLYTEIAPYLLRCVEQLVQEHGVEVHIVRWPLNQEAPFRFGEREGITLHERKAFSTPALRRFAKELQPDIIVASGWVDKGYLQVCRDARNRGVPTVMCGDTAWRGDLRQWVAVVASRFWLRRTFSHAWITGEAQARYVERLGFPKSCIRRGFYAADIDLAASVEARSRTAKAERFPHRLLCVARYIPSKGHQYLVESFAELCDTGQAGDWELWCIGTGELFPLPHQHPRIRHIGFVQADAMGPYMEQCGVFVLPSLYEPWGVVVHEFAAAGLPLLLSDAVGARFRFLREGENGHSFLAGDADSLKQAIRKIVATPDPELAAMGQRSGELGRSWGPSQWADILVRLISPQHA